MTLMAVVVIVTGLAFVKVIQQQLVVKNQTCGVMLIFNYLLSCESLEK